MPGDQKHHTDKFRSCVQKVMDSGKAEDSAYAICTTSLQDAGEPIFEGAESRSAEEIRLLGEHIRMSLPRHLHLLGAMGTVRIEKWNGRDHIVVPVVALMEGVIHAVNAQTPEFVPLATLQKAATSWNGKPVTLGHPKANGKQCSASAPEALGSHIGVIRNARVEGKKMLHEAWIDSEKAKIAHADMHARLMAGKSEEVSVGAFVVTDGKAGRHTDGKEYKASWLETSGDHLAFLPGGRGACSIAMGCGSHRAAMRVCGEDLESVPQVPVLTFTTLEEKSLDERMQAVNVAVSEKWRQQDMVQPSFGAYAQQVFDDRVIVRKGDETFSVEYTVDDEGKVTLGTATKVVQKWVEAEMRAAAGARNSSKDAKMIQDMHDGAVMLGAKCDRGNYETAAQKMMDCPTCEGTGSVKGNPCPTCDGEGEVPMKAASAVRHEGGLWVLYSSTGERRLGSHATKEEAEAQREAIVRSLARQKIS